MDEIGSRKKTDLTKRAQQLCKSFSEVSWKHTTRCAFSHFMLHFDMWDFDGKPYLSDRGVSILKKEVAKVEDQEIVQLYHERCEDAIHETNLKYGKLCRRISFGILGDSRDSEEVVSDTWMALWNSIPPKRPESFKAYVCRVAKNLALKRYEYDHAQKRRCNYEDSLEELKECIGVQKGVEERILEKELTESVNRFLGSLPKEKRLLFLKRYWFLYSVKELAAENRVSEKTMSMRLARLRKQLKKYLEQEGYML